eukprot:864562_1
MSGELTFCSSSEEMDKDMNEDIIIEITNIEAQIQHLTTKEPKQSSDFKLFPKLIKTIIMTCNIFVLLFLQYIYQFQILTKFNHIITILIWYLNGICVAQCG